MSLGHGLPHGSKPFDDLQRIIFGVQIDCGRIQHRVLMLSPTLAVSQDLIEQEPTTRTVALGSKSSGILNLTIRALYVH
nr:hypothetical protein [Propionicimonas sp.]